MTEKNLLSGPKNPRFVDFLRQKCHLRSPKYQTTRRSNPQPALTCCPYQQSRPFALCPEIQDLHTPPTMAASCFTTLVSYRCQDYTAHFLRDVPFLPPPFSPQSHPGLRVGLPCSQMQVRSVPACDRLRRSMSSMVPLLLSLAFDGLRCTLICRPLTRAPFCVSFL